MNIHVFLDGARISLRAQKARITGIKKYKGSIEEMCREIIEDSYNKKKGYFMVSSGNFKEFYARDFGMCCESLIKLGYKDKIRKTLEFAMKKYVSHGRITTHITPWGKPVNFPYHTPESASYMLNSLIMLGDKKLISKYKPFFQEEAKRIFAEDIDKRTGLLRGDKYFSSMKDYAKRKSSCYNNCFVALFAENLKKINVASPFSGYDYKEKILGDFWNGDYFYEDLEKKKVVSGDANTFPFWTGIVRDKKLLRKAISSMHARKLDVPWPLQYTSKEETINKFHYADLFVPGYEADTIWMHLGVCYLKVLDRYEEKKLLLRHLKEYELLIDKHKTFYEVYTSEGKPFSTLLYKSDDAMIWVSVFLELYLKHFKRVQP